MSTEISNEYDQLADILRLLLQAERQTALEYFYTVLRYFSVAAHPPTITEFKEALATTVLQQVGGLRQSFAEAWVQVGIEKGRQQQAAPLALRLLQRQLGILEAETQKRIRELPLDRLEQLVDTLLDHQFQSRDDLAAWLPEHGNGDAQ